jgi:hypothetical protein
MSRIPPAEVDWHQHSFADPDGRLFRWRGELYRALRGRAPLQAQLLDEGVLAELSKLGLLIETERTELELEGFELVLRHRSVPFVSYPNEWSAPMFKDAVLILLDLAAKLASRGLMLKDAHPWNVLFDGTKPVWVDVGSIAVDDVGRWSAADEFVRFCLNPLLLMADGHGRLARHLLPEYEGVSDAELRLIRRRAILRRASRLASDVFRSLPVDQRRRAAFFETLREQVAAIEMPGGRVPTDSSGQTDDAVGALLDEWRPASVLTVESQSAARLIASKGIPLVAIEAAEDVSAQLYDSARERRVPVSSLVMDFTKPTPSRGIGEHWQISATTRLRCEIVVAVGVARRVNAQRRLPISRILEGLAAFASRWVVVDEVDDDELARGLTCVDRRGPLVILEREDARSTYRG